MMTTVPSSSPYNNMEHSFSPSDLNFMVIASIIQAFFFIYTVYLLLNGAASKFASSISGDASLQIFTFLHVLSGFDTHISTQLHLDEPAFTVSNQFSRLFISPYNFSRVFISDLEHIVHISHGSLPSATFLCFPPITSSTCSQTCGR